jgi:hypothetical protein
MLIAIVLLPLGRSIEAGLGAAALGLFSANSLAARSEIVSLNSVSFRGALLRRTLRTLPAIARAGERGTQRQASTVR